MRRPLVHASCWVWAGRRAPQKAPRLPRSFWVWMQLLQPTSLTAKETSSAPADGGLTRARVLPCAAKPCCIGGSVKVPPRATDHAVPQRLARQSVANSEVRRKSAVLKFQNWLRALTGNGAGLLAILTLIALRPFVEAPILPPRGCITESGFVCSKRGKI